MGDIHFRIEKLVFYTLDCKWANTADPLTQTSCFAVCGAMLTYWNCVLLCGHAWHHAYLSALSGAARHLLVWYGVNPPLNEVVGCCSCL